MTIFLWKYTFRIRIGEITARNFPFSVESRCFSASPVTLTTNPLPMDTFEVYLLSVRLWIYDLPDFSGVKPINVACRPERHIPEIVSAAGFPNSAVLVLLNTYGYYREYTKTTVFEHFTIRSPV